MIRGLAIYGMRPLISGGTVGRLGVERVAITIQVTVGTPLAASCQRAHSVQHVVSITLRQEYQVLILHAGIRSLRLCTELWCDSEGIPIFFHSPVPSTLVISSTQMKRKDKICLIIPEDEDTFDEEPGRLAPQASPAQHDTSGSPGKQRSRLMNFQRIHP